MARTRHAGQILHRLVPPLHGAARRHILRLPRARGLGFLGWGVGSCCGGRRHAVGHALGAVGWVGGLRRGVAALQRPAGERVRRYGTRRGRGEGCD